MRKLPAFHELNFLLDENVSYNLFKLLKSKGFNVETVQELNKHGIKNSELLDLVKITKKILITYDKDFLDLKIEKEHYIIVIDIHPLIDENVLPRFEEFINSLSLIDLRDNILILREKDFELNKK